MMFLTVLIQYIFFSNVYFISAYGNVICIRTWVSPGIVLKLQPFLIFENLTKCRMSWVNIESKINLIYLYPKWCSVVGCSFFKGRISLPLAFWVSVAGFFYCPSCSIAMLKPPGETVTPVLFVCVCLKLCILLKSWTLLLCWGIWSPSVCLGLWAFPWIITVTADDRSQHQP